MTNIQARLVEIMEEKHINVTQLEKKTGVARSTCVNILNGTSPNPTAKTLKALAQGLDIALESLIGKNAAPTNN